MYPIGGRKRAIKYIHKEIYEKKNPNNKEGLKQDVTKKKRPQKSTSQKKSKAMPIFIKLDAFEFT